MRVCDRCSGASVVRTLTNVRAGLEVDLCTPCYDTFLTFIAKEQPERAVATVEPTKRGRGRPRKETSDGGGDVAAPPTHDA